MKYFDNIPVQFDIIEILDKRELLKEKEELQDALSIHNHYYNFKKEPKISDDDYNRLKLRLQEINKHLSTLKEE